MSISGIAEDDDIQGKIQNLEELTYEKIPDIQEWKSECPGFFWLFDSGCKNDYQAFCLNQHDFQI